MSKGWQKTWQTFAKWITTRFWPRGKDFYCWPKSWFERWCNELRKVSILMAHSANQISKRFIQSERSIYSLICKPCLGSKFKNIVQPSLTHWRFESFYISGNNFKAIQDFILTSFISLPFTNFYNKTFNSFYLSPERVVGDTARVQPNGPGLGQFSVMQCYLWNKYKTIPLYEFCQCIIPFEYFVIYIW